MALGGVLLGLINIAITVGILILIGLVIVWFMGWLGFAVPANVQKSLHGRCGLDRARNVSGSLVGCSIASDLSTMIWRIAIFIGMLVAIVLGVYFGGIWNCCWLG